MAEIIINDVKYTNVPNKKAGTKFASALTQSNIGMSQAVQDYVNSSYFYALINAIDINWDGIDIGENTYINTTSDLIKWIESKAGDIDLSSYATVSYVNQKFEDLIGGAPETLDTLKELADALQEDASLAYVTQALEGKADKTDLNDYATVAYVTTELDKKADLSDIPSAPDLTPYVTYTDANSYYVAKEDMPDIPDVSNYLTYTQANSYYLQMSGGNYNPITNFVKLGDKLIFASKHPLVDAYGDGATIKGEIERINNQDYYKLCLNLKDGVSNLSSFYIRNPHANHIYDITLPGGYDISKWDGDNTNIVYFPLAFWANKNNNYSVLKANNQGLVNLNEIIPDITNFVTYTDANTYYAGKNEIPDMSNYVSYTQANSYYVAKGDMPDLNDYATVSYVTSELDKKADLSDIPSAPDLTNYVSYTDANSYYMTVEGPKQTINSIKTFVGNKLINFRQGTSTDKLGFTLYNSDEKEVGGLEWRPDTIDGKPLMSLQHYVNTANMSTIAQSYLGFRQTQGKWKYNLLAPIPTDVSRIEDISSSSDYKNFFMPLLFRNGSNRVYTDCKGLVDMAPIMNDYATVSYVTSELDKKADLSDIPSAPDLTNYVSYTDANSYYMTVEGPKQIIHGVKTFVGNKLINFRQSTSTDKLGFTLYNTNEKELGGLEWRPDTIGGRSLLSLQQYLGTGTKYEGIDMGYLGFRLAEASSKYNLITPLPSHVNTIETINVSNNYRNFFLPLVFKNGNNKVYTECTGLVDMASLMPDLTNYVSYTDANSYYAPKNEQVFYNLTAEGVGINIAYTRPPHDINFIATKLDSAAVGYDSFNSLVISDIDSNANLKLNLANTIIGGELYKPNPVDSQYVSTYLTESIAVGSNITAYWMQSENTYKPVANCLIVGENLVSRNSKQLIVGKWNECTYLWWDKSNPQGQTMFAVGNGAKNARHNAFEVRDNGDIYISDTKYGDPYRLQDRLDMSSYVPMTSYNALAARVEELASWIVSYHTPVIQDVSLWHTRDGSSIASYLSNNGSQTRTLDISDSTTHTINFDSNVNDIVMSVNGISTGITVNNTVWPYSIEYTPSMMTEGGNYSFGFSRNMDSSYNAFSSSFKFTVESSTPTKESTRGSWSNTQTINWGESTISVIAGDTNTVTCTFNGTPSSGWALKSDPMITGISIDSSTMSVTIDPTNMTAGNSYDIEFEHPEDSSYYYGTCRLTINVIRSGVNPNFYFNEDTYYLSQDTGATPTITNTLNPSSHHVEYTSADPTIASIGNRYFSTLRYVSDGTTTITANAYDSGGNVIATATATVTCTSF